MDKLQIFKAHLPQQYEDYATEGLERGECHHYKKQYYFVQINLLKMELDGANKDAVVIVAQSAKRVFGAVYHQRKEVFKAEPPGGHETMPGMERVLNGSIVVQEKKDYSGDPLTKDQQTLLDYLKQKTPAKHQDPIDSETLF